LHADDDLAAIRAKRMAQLRGAAPVGMQGLPPGMSGMPPGMGGMPTQQGQREQQEKQKAADEQRAQILKALLTPEARERRKSAFVIFLPPILLLSPSIFKRQHPQVFL